MDDIEDELTQLRIDNAKKEGALEERKKITKWLCTVSVSATVALGSLFYQAGAAIVHNFEAVKAAFITYWNISGGGK
jgi:hypothetical protein